MGTFATARRVFRTQGLVGVTAALKDRYFNNWAGRQIDRYYGALLEFRGDSIKVDGCTFSLKSPAITRESKSKFMLNRYERPEREAVRRFLDPECPIVEFGGAIGVVSCLANRRLARPMEHVVVEANPDLVPVLLKNRELNGCKFTVLPRLVAYGRKRAAFFVDETNFVIGSAVAGPSNHAKGVVEVETITLGAILEQYHFGVCTLICDIEGGEADLLRYESEILKSRVSTLILEVHEWILGQGRVQELLANIGSLGFRLLASEGDTYTFRKAR
jgi:FkbM family methyltransferase